VVSFLSCSCGSHLPLGENADRVIILGPFQCHLLTGRPAQEFLQSFRLAVGGRAEGQSINPGDGFRLIIADGFSGPGRVLLYDESRKLVSYRGRTYHLARQFPWPQPQDGVRSFAVGTSGFPGPVVRWLKSKNEEKGAVLGLGGLFGDGNILVVSAGSQAGGGNAVSLVNADYTDGTWRFMFQYLESHESSPRVDEAAVTLGFVATLPTAAKVEVYEAGAKSKIVGGSVGEERIPLQNPIPAGPTLADVCQSLFGDYLLGYKSSDVDDSHRLSDYRIERLQFRSEWPSTGRVTFLVEYSVLPASEKSFSHWLPANGQIGPGGWILNKAAFVNIIDEGAGYYIQNIGGGGQ
jgi:hypothetical protein